jgi:hypothetical protein
MTVVGQAVLLGSATMCIGLAMDPPTYVAPVTLRWAAAGLYGLAAFDLIDTLMLRPISMLTLRRSYEEIRTPELRARMSRDDLANVEARFRRSTSLFPPFIRSVFLSGIALGAMLTAIDRSQAQQDTAFITGTTMVWLSVEYLVLSPLQGYQSYRRALAGAGLTPMVTTSGAAGVALSGRF